jgi:predicted small lipoprotein YifL
MKKLLILLLALSLILTFTACNEDVPITPPSEDDTPQMEEQQAAEEIIEQVNHEIDNVKEDEDEDEDEVEDEVENEIEPEPELSQGSSVSAVTGQPNISIDEFIVQGEDGPVLDLDRRNVDKVHVSTDEFGLEMRIAFTTVHSVELAPIMHAAMSSFGDLVQKISNTDLLSVVQMVDEYETNLEAVRQTIENAGLNLVDLSIGPFSAQMEYNLHRAWIMIIRQAIAEVERERVVVLGAEMGD